MIEGVNLTNIYYKDFVNVTVYPWYNYNMLIYHLKKNEKEIK
jgi:hypothetical protein